MIPEILSELRELHGLRLSPVVPINSQRTIFSEHFQVRRFPGNGEVYESKYVCDVAATSAVIMPGLHNPDHLVVFINSGYTSRGVCWVPLADPKCLDLFRESVSQRLRAMLSDPDSEFELPRDE